MSEGWFMSGLIWFAEVFNPDRFYIPLDSQDGLPVGGKFPAAAFIPVRLVKLLGLAGLTLCEHNSVSTYAFIRLYPVW
jgi:hypothetical protein